MRNLLLLFVCLLELQAANIQSLSGKWSALQQTNNRGTLTIEKEYLTLNADKTFTILVLVSVQKGDAFVKDLRIEGTGIWKVWKDKLVVVVNDVQVPKAGEVYRISQTSLEQLAATFKHRFVNEPIRINIIQSHDRTHLTTKNEKGKITRYSR